MMKRINILFCILFLIISLLIPFHHVSADTVAGSSPIIGVNITIRDYESQRVIDGLTISLDDTADRWRCVSFNSSGACNAYGSADTSNQYVNHQILGEIIDDTYYELTTRIYEYEFILDSSYVGYITFSSSFGSNSNATYYINGTSFKVTATTLTRSFTVSAYSLNRNDLGNQWSYPIESFPWASYMLNNLYNRYYGINSYSSYIFPIFNVQPGDVIYAGNTAATWTWDLILYVNRSVNSSSIGNYITLPANASFQNWTMINRFNLNGTLGYLFKVQIVFNISSGSSSNSFNLVWKGGPNSNLDALLMPIYFNPVYDRSYISTDFALNFGLSNQLLDDLHIIASNFQGNQIVDNAVDNLDDQSNDLGSNIDSMIQTEEGYNNDFNSALNNIDFSDPVSNNQGLLSSANFVISVFNGLTQNNFIGTFIVIILVLVIGKKVIGK